MGLLSLGERKEKRDASLLEIILAIETEIAINKCLCENTSCEQIEKETYVIHLVLADLNETVKSRFAKLKIQDVAPSFLL